MATSVEYQNYENQMHSVVGWALAFCDVPLNSVSKLDWARMQDAARELRRLGREILNQNVNRKPPVTPLNPGE